MNLTINIINYTAFAIILYGFTSILMAEFRRRDIAFLSGTSLLSLGAIITWLNEPKIEVFAFVLLFLLQVIANILQIKSKSDKLNTIILVLLSLLLFVYFLLVGLFENHTFFLIAFGTAITGIGYKEKPEHTLRQSVLFIIGIVFEIAFALITSQVFYTVLNAVSLLFVMTILIVSLRRKT